MLTTGPLEPTAINQIHQALPVFGRGLRAYGEGKRSLENSVAGDAPEQATDATGLSFSSGDVALALASLEQEQAARAHEMTYLAAGARAWRTAHPSNGERPLPDALASASATQTPFSAGALSGRAEEPPAQPLARPDAANAGTLSGGAESRTASRTFMGSSAASSDSGGNAEANDSQRRLTEDEQREVERLKVRDRETRAHEQAHLSASGGLAMGGASYQQERGPDGRMYAVGGEVRIDTSEGGTPDETITKARRIRNAALAPAQPSGQDRQVAAQASRMEADARMEKNSGEEDRTGATATGGTGRLAMRMEQAQTAYVRASGSYAPAPWGTGLSFSV